MSISANTQPQRARVKIVTVDIANLRVEAAMKDGSLAQIPVWDDVPHAFRWPKEQEIWIIERGRDLVWRLAARSQGGQVSGSGTEVSVDSEPVPLSSMTPGEMKLDSIKVVDANGRQFIAADLAGVQENWTLRWDTTFECFVVEPFPTPTIIASQQYGSYIFQPADAWTVVESMSATPVTFSLPLHPYGPFAIETIIEVFQYGAGQVTIAGLAGVSVISDSNRTRTAAQYSTIGLRQRALNEWVISGDLV